MRDLKERRHHSRAKTEIFVRFSDPNDQQQHYREGKIENCSAGGMYIITDHPAPKGSSLQLKFHLGSHANDVLPIKILTTVRWVRLVAQPRGMGVEFLEFEGIDERDFKEWITSLRGDMT